MKMRFMSVALRMAGDDKVAADRAPVQTKYRRWNNSPAIPATRLINGWQRWRQDDGSTAEKMPKTKSPGQHARGFVR
jgi:hypothetical protein